MLETNIQPSDTIMSREDPSMDDAIPPQALTHDRIERGRKSKRPKRDRSAQVTHPPEFILDGWKSTFKPQEYNGLKDKHLLGHFYNKRIRKLLKQNHLISKNDQVIEGKTCLTDFEIQKQNNLFEDLSYKPTRNGAILLSVKLPKIHPFPRLENRMHKNRSTSVTQNNSQVYEISSNRLMSITPTGTQDISTTTNLHDTSSQDNSFSNINTPLTNANTSILRDQREVLSERNPNKKKRSKRTVLPPMVDAKDLEPMSREDLKAAFSKYKTRLSQAIIVDESPELNPIVSGASVTLQEGISTQVGDHMYNSAPLEHSEKVGRGESKESQKRIIVVEHSTGIKKKLKAERSGSLSPRIVQKSNRNNRVSQGSTKLKYKGSNTLEPLLSDSKTRKKSENDKLNTSVTRPGRHTVQPFKKQETGSDKSKEIVISDQKENERHKKSPVQPIGNKSIFQMQMEQATVKSARKDLTQSVLRQSSKQNSPAKSTGSPRKEKTASSVEIQKDGSRSPKKDLSQSGILKSPKPFEDKNSPRKSSNSPRKDLGQSQNRRVKTSFDETIRNSKEDIKKSTDRKPKPYENSLPTIKAQDTSTKRERSRTVVATHKTNTSATIGNNGKSQDLKKQPTIRDSQELGKGKVQQTGRKVQMVKVLNQSFEANKKELKKESLNQTIDVVPNPDQEVLAQVNPSILGMVLFHKKPFDISLKEKIQELFKSKKSQSKPATPRAAAQPSKVNQKDTKKKGKS